MISGVYAAELDAVDHLVVEVDDEAHGTLHLLVMKAAGGLIS